MSVELDDAFKTFMRCLRKPSEETRMVISQPEMPAVATNTNQ